MLLDTHVALWWASAPAALSQRARTEIARAGEVLVSPISCWEIATLARLGRIALDRDLGAWFAGLYALDRVRPAPLSPSAGALAGALDATFPGDPADRLLYATARDLAVPLVTKDRAIRAWSREARDVRTVW